MSNILSRSFSGGLVLALLMIGAGVQAADAPTDPKKQTPWGLYLTSTEAYDFKQKHGETALFVDVREPVEIMFTGFTDVVDVNVPFLMVNPTKWNPKKPKLAMEKNPEFANQVLTALEARGLDKDTPVLLMCRSGGTRGAPSAKALVGTGLTQVYVVVDGFEGGSSKTDPNGPHRNVSGWKNSGLPWGYKLNPDKIFLRSTNW